MCHERGNAHEQPPAKKPASLMQLQRRGQSLNEGDDQQNSAHHRCKAGGWGLKEMGGGFLDNLHNVGGRLKCSAHAVRAQCNYLGVRRPCFVVLWASLLFGSRF